MNSGRPFKSSSNYSKCFDELVVNVVSKVTVRDFDPNDPRLRRSQDAGVNVEGSGRGLEAFEGRSGSEENRTEEVGQNEEVEESTRPDTVLRV